MTVRPSETILNSFYGIADLDDAKRFKSIACLVLNADTKELRDYCIERLIGGLSSARAAARVGYSTALSHMLPAASEDWDAKRLFKAAEAKLELDDKETASNNAIGRHLLYTVMVVSGCYTKNNREIAEKELTLTEQFAFISLSAWDTVAKLSDPLSESEFKTAVWPEISKRLPSKLADFRPEHLFLVLQLTAKFGVILAENAPLISKKGTFDFSEENIASVFTILKKSGATVLPPLINRLMTAAREAKKYSEVYRGVVEQWAIFSENTKVMKRLFEMAEFVLQKSSDHTEILAVLSPVLMKKIQFLCKGKNNPEKKAAKARLLEFIAVIVEHIAEVTDAEFYLSIITLFDEVGPFDTLVNSRFTEKLVAKLEGAALDKFLKAAETAPGWSIRRVASAFTHWSAESKKRALLAIVSDSFPKTEDRHVVIANCIDHVFKVKVRPGEQATVTVSEEDEALLKEVAKALVGQAEIKKATKALKAADKLTRPLTVLWTCIRLWASVTPDEDEVKGYLENAEETLTLASKVGKDKEGTKVLIDLLISLLGQPRKHHRSVAYFVYTHVLSTITTDDVKHILETLSLSDDELAGGEEDEEDDDDEEMNDMEEGEGMDDDDEEAAANGEAEEGEEDDDAKAGVSSEEEADEDSDSDLDDMGEVDQELVDRLQKALGKAAVKPSADDKAQESDEDAADSGVDDEEMFKLDAGLAAAFKTISGKQGKKVKLDATRFAQPLRAKLADLLLFTLSSTETAPLVKLNTAVPLLALAKVQLKRSADEAATKKAFELLDVATHLKKLDVSEKNILAAFGDLTKEASGITNPTLRNLVSNLAGWMFVLGTHGDKPLSATFKKAFLDLLEQFMKQEEGHIGSELATAALLKYPNSFASDLPKLTAYAFDEDVRIFRRTEALLCAIALTRKDVVKQSGLDKTAIKLVGKHAAAFLDALDVNDVKPRFFAALLKLLVSLVNVADESQKKTLSLSVHGVVNSLVEKEELWKQGGQMKKTFPACQQISGKSPLALLKIIQKELNLI